MGDNDRWKRSLYGMVKWNVPNYNKRWKEDLKFFLCCLNKFEQCKTKHTILWHKGKSGQLIGPPRQWAKEEIENFFDMKFIWM